MMTWKRMLAAVACLAFANPCRAAEPTLEETFADKRLLFCFQGKGSCLPYDAGVLHAAHEHILAIGRGQVIAAGNSSGSIPAAYFGCFGFSDATVRHAEARLLKGDRQAVRDMENPNSKLSKLAQGKRTEIPHSVLREYIAFALGVENWRDATIDEIIARSTARPRYPVMIVACNKEVLEDSHPADRNAARQLKTLDLNTMSVSWEPRAFAFYRQHPERFRREHPDLKLGDGPRIGHAVTYFVDRSMYELLRRIPAEERQADLRLMRNARDVALAILASTSEPTYFDPVVDREPGKLLTWKTPGELGNVRQRTYYGGYIIAVPAQDVRRMLPGTRVLGTGWRHNPLMARRLLRNWLLADVEPVAQRAEWWVDLEANPDEEFQSHMGVRDLSNQQEFDFGRRRAEECFAGRAGLPTYAVPPPEQLRMPAAGAILPSFDAAEMFRESADGKQELRTLRGMGPLLATPDSAVE